MNEEARCWEELDPEVQEDRQVMKAEMLRLAMSHLQDAGHAALELKGLDSVYSAFDEAVERLIALVEMGGELEGVDPYEPCEWVS